MNRKIFLLSCVLSLLVLLTCTPVASVLAQSPEATDSAELRRAIRQRIEQTLQNGSETVSPYVGYIGNVEQIGTATFTLITPRGENRTIQAGSGTALVSGTQTIQLNELVVGNGVSVIGREMDDLVVDALRVVATNAPFEETRQVVIGNITNIDSRSITIQVRSSETIEIYNIDRTTLYEDIQGTGITVRDLEVDQAALVVTDVNTQNQRYIKRFRLLIPIEE